MNWDHHRAELALGKSVQFRPKGNSMTPLIKSGQLVTVLPITIPSVLEKGTIVFCKVNGSYYVHKITAVKDNQIQIGNNKGRINGWTIGANIFGVVVKIED